jgi:hypothetical protein
MNLLLSIESTLPAPTAQRLILSSSVRGSSSHKDSLPSAAGAAQRSNSGQKSSILGGSAAVVHARSINILLSTTSPRNTTKQTTSRPSSMASRRRPLPSEPGATRSRRRVREFHARSFCSMDTVLCIRNVACPQTRPSAMSRPARIYRAEAVRSKIPADEVIALATAGHLARSSTLGDEAFRARALAPPPLRDQDLDARLGRDAGSTDLRRECQLRRHVSSVARPSFPKKHRYVSRRRRVRVGEYVWYMRTKT